jgi:WD40 repeat protein
VSKVAFDPDGQRLATADMDKTARVWDAATGRELAAPMTHDENQLLLGDVNPLQSIAFSPNGQHLATAGMDNTARVWDAATGRELARLRHAGPVSNAAFSPDSRRLTTFSRDNTARVWDAATGRELVRVNQDVAAFSPDGQRLATLSFYGDQKVQIWELTSGAELAWMPHKGVTRAVFSIVCPIMIYT